MNVLAIQGIVPVKAGAVSWLMEPGKQDAAEAFDVSQLIGMSPDELMRLEQQVREGKQPNIRAAS